jgi:hypothetical protein
MPVEPASCEQCHDDLFLLIFEVIVLSKVERREFTQVSDTEGQDYKHELEAPEPLPDLHQSLKGQFSELIPLMNQPFICDFN